MSSSMDQFVSVQLRDTLYVICCFVMLKKIQKKYKDVDFIASLHIQNIVNYKKNVIDFVFLYISDLFYFVVNKKVKIQSHELNSLHHSLKKKQHKITNHITKNRIGKYSNHINSPLMLSIPPPTAHLPTADPVKL